MAPAAALAGRDIRPNPATWTAYRELIHAVVNAVAHLPVVMLGPCTPGELANWPIDVWVLLDCTDHERLRRFPIASIRASHKTPFMTRTSTARLVCLSSARAAVPRHRSRLPSRTSCGNGSSRNRKAESVVLNFDLILIRVPCRSGARAYSRSRSEGRWHPHAAAETVRRESRWWRQWPRPPGRPARVEVTAARASARARVGRTGTSG